MVHQRLGHTRVKRVIKGRLNSRYPSLILSFGGGNTEYKGMTMTSVKRAVGYLDVEVSTFPNSSKSLMFF